MHASKTILIALLVLGFTGCFHKRETKEQAAVERINDSTLKLAPDALKNIKLAKAEMGEFPDRLSLMGRISVTEDRVAVVPGRIAGRIDAVYVSSGETVVKDQVLASLFSADFAIAREEYLQALHQPLEGDGSSLVQMAKKKLEAIGMSATDVAKLTDPANKNTTNLTIRAPRNGAILDKKAVVGNVVNVGDTLFTIGDLNKVWFAGDIYPEDLSKIRKNQEVVIDPANDRHPIYGKISFVSPVIDPTTRTIKIRALMDNPNGQLRGDMYVQGNITLSRQTALLVPSGALIRLHDSTFCFKRLKENLFQKVSLEVQKEQNGAAIVAKGLDPGTEVVSDGGLLLDAALTTTDQ